MNIVVEAVTRCQQTEQSLPRWPIHLHCGGLRRNVACTPATRIVVLGRRSDQSDQFLVRVVPLLAPLLEWCELYQHQVNRSETRCSAQRGE